eukprot:CAMPEP_0176373504 /NCGR_PEP_ID=MMETSP0126-20121128/26082_1 /TAXON_ID=141414 ORGANISM="Strombidinopsis acuminatum, Strain SPMC142" /NCGR_SAMPLE_ID=MMETSP0126 /ASSEMBLY_ACC=CAM_ASM_000229 /LENGTH=173 /DNA_ID=CAMNT_0017733663 /DNA_START=1082 /DNA_END=1603 /DNA_ORIENTATION=+
MQLANECIVISLIYLEKMMMTGKIEIRNINWRPLLFTALLLASKFWEDVNLWNIDYAEEIDLYPLKSINRMESEFLSLCDYNIYVSADLYSRYQAKVRELSNPILATSHRGPQGGRPSHFNRFKHIGVSGKQANASLLSNPSNAAPPPMITVVKAPAQDEDRKIRMMQNPEFR